MIRKIRPYILFSVLVLAVAACVCLFQLTPDTKASIATFIVNPLFSGGKAALFNSISFALFCLVIVTSVISGRSGLKVTVVKALKIVGAAAICWGIGFLLADIVPDSSRTYVFVMVALLEINTVVTLYSRKRKRAGDISASVAIRKSAASSGRIKYAYSVLYGALTALMAANIVFFALTYPECTNHIILVSLSAVIISLIIWRLLRWRGILVFTFVILVFLYILQMYTCISTPESWAYAWMTTILYCAVATPVCDLYCRKEAAV